MKKNLPSFFLYFLSFVLCFSFFTVSLSPRTLAASDNLLNDDLSEWECLTDVSSDSWVDCRDDYGYTVYRFFGKGTTVGAGSNLVQIYYDLGNLIAGHSYTFTFHLPDLADIQACYNTTMSDSTLRGYYKNATLSLGYGFLNADGSIGQTTELFEINSSNLSSHLGRSLSASFVANSGTGRPAFFILISADDSNSHYFFLQDFKLVDNDDNSKELTGIRGFLHSIRWDLVGGICDEEDCPHSSSSNPHLSLTDRMSAGFQSFFDSLGTSIFNLGEAIGDKLNFNFSESILNVNQGFTNIGSWFDNLGSRISGFFDNLGNRISGFFTNLGNRISGFFTDLWKNISSWFEKFKPRVYLDFFWQYGYIDDARIEIHDENMGTAIITDSFAVNSPYYFDFDAFTHSAMSYLYVFRYAPSGDVTVREYDPHTESSYSGVKLEKGYYYRFMILDDSYYIPNDGPVTEYCNSILRVYADEGWTNAIFHNIKTFFSGCVNLILYFDFYGEYSNPFEQDGNVLDTIEEFSQRIIDYVADSAKNLEDTIDSVSGAIEVFASFVERFPWLFGIVGFVLILTVYTRFIGL